MKRRMLTQVLMMSIVSVSAVPVVACDGASGPNAVVTAPTATVAADAPAATGFSLEAALVAAIQDEYHAEAVYARILSDVGNVNPFANIIRAERMHAASLAALFTARGLTPPPSEWTTTNVPGFDSVQAACAAAAQAEIDNVAVYDRYLGEALPDDVRVVFVNNRAASLNNHLPAFNRCK